MLVESSFQLAVSSLGRNLIGMCLGAAFSAEGDLISWLPVGKQGPEGGRLVAPATGLLGSHAIRLPFGRDVTGNDPALGSQEFMGHESGEFVSEELELGLQSIAGEAMGLQPSPVPMLGTELGGVGPGLGDVDQGTGRVTGMTREGIHGDVVDPAEGEGGLARFAHVYLTVGLLNLNLKNSSCFVDGGSDIGVETYLEVLVPGVATPGKYPCSILDVCTCQGYTGLVTLCFQDSFQERVCKLPGQVGAQAVLGPRLVTPECTEEGVGF